MKTLFWPIVLLAFAFSGCGSGDVIVKSKSPDPSLENGNVENAGFGEGLPKSSSSTERIYFERVLVDLGRIQTVIAVSFASPKSKTVIPFGFSVRLRRDLGVGSVFSLASHQLVYLHTNGDSGATLMSTTLNQMTSQLLAEFPGPIARFSLNQLASRVAWIDWQGKVFVSELSSKVSTHIPVENSNVLTLPHSEDRAVSVAWDSSTLQLLVKTEAGAALLYSVSDRGFVLSQQVTDTVAAVFSPDSASVAFVKKDHSVFLAGLSSDGVKTLPAQALKLPDTPAYDISWSSRNALTYWIRTQNGPNHNEIRTLNLSSGKESRISELNLPADSRDGIACPVWLGDTLYFGSFVNGVYLIERIRQGQREVFAAPPAPDEGLICPKTERPGPA